ncbi:SSI family serine proteinase inhibitor [Blastococcus montanus]|uniref:SSI family serine proteinase inhibitor n=1 Tax=Blastococcus montanus TaxID=3144973 RepID=UPI00320B525B
MRRLLPLVLLALVAALGGCATGDDGWPAPGAVGGSPTTPADGGAGSGVARAENDLRIEVDLGDGSPPQTWTLTCDGSAEGSHPQAEAACEHLRGMSEPFAPVPEDAVCTQQYGGPQTARITGQWAAEPVDLELSRENGCTIAQWDSLGPVLPVPVGIQPLA